MIQRKSHSVDAGYLDDEEDDVGHLPVAAQVTELVFTPITFQP